MGVSLAFSASPQYLEGMGALRAKQRFALGALPVAKVACCHSATDLMFSVRATNSCLNGRLDNDWIGVTDEEGDMGLSGAPTCCRGADTPGDSVRDLSNLRW